LAVSAFDLFKIGIGPSSSHTVGPMRAARQFAARLDRLGLLEATAALRVELYGSLGATGRGHSTDTAVILGLLGEQPDLVDPGAVRARVSAVRDARRLSVLGIHDVPFDPETVIVFSGRPSFDGTEPFHANNMRFVATGIGGDEILARTFCSVGGGFVVDQEVEAAGIDAAQKAPPVPFPFTGGAELLAFASGSDLSIADLVRANERTWRTDAEIDVGLLAIWSVMMSCMERGMSEDGVLPGGLGVRRRARSFREELLARASGCDRADPLDVLDWVNLFAMAVNEENAAGGRVVTAPTNGSAGIIPAVLRYYTDFVPGSGERGVIDFLLTATAVGVLFKENASISGAEVGCQGEVGVASSMAAAGLCAVLGGTPGQVENAAEIGIEHNLGLTCDPVGGLVQIPCIERNALAAVKAISAARMAIVGDGTHHVSLDAAIRPCARRAPTCTTSTRRRPVAGWPSASSNARAARGPSAGRGPGSVGVQRLVRRPDADGIDPHAQALPARRAAHRPHLDLRRGRQECHSQENPIAIAGAVPNDDGVPGPARSERDRAMRRNARHGARGPVRGPVRHDDAGLELPLDQFEPRLDPLRRGRLDHQPCLVVEGRELRLERHLDRGVADDPTAEEVTRIAHVPVVGGAPVVRPIARHDQQPAVSLLRVGGRVVPGIGHPGIHSNRDLLRRLVSRGGRDHLVHRTAVEVPIIWASSITAPGIGFAATAPSLGQGPALHLPSRDVMAGLSCGPFASRPE
jgi:L-serine dehydratase